MPVNDYALRWREMKPHMQTFIFGSILSTAFVTFAEIKSSRLATAHILLGNIPIDFGLA